MHAIPELGISPGRGNAGGIRDMHAIPELGISPGRGNDNPLQCSCLGNPTDRKAWWTIVQGSQRIGHN